MKKLILFLALLSIFSLAKADQFGPRSVGGYAASATGTIHAGCRKVWVYISGTGSFTVGTGTVTGFASTITTVYLLADSQEVLSDIAYKSTGTVTIIEER